MTRMNVDERSVADRAYCGVSEAKKKKKSDNHTIFYVGELLLKI